MFVRGLVEGERCSGLKDQSWRLVGGLGGRAEGWALGGTLAREPQGSFGEGLWA